MSSDPWLTEMYFDFLSSEAFSARVNRREYSGCLRLLNDIPFFWTLWPDEDRAGDALSFRQHDFLGYQIDLDSLDQVWLKVWAEAAPSVLEVLLGISRRWSVFFGGDIHYYFGHMFRNMEYDRHPGVILPQSSANGLREKTQVWLTRQFASDGKGSPFPINADVIFNELHQRIDMREIPIWNQMNVYSYEHFQ